MKAVKVQYTVVPEYVDQNKANIQNVMNALKRNPIEGMLYSSYTMDEDPNTFVHINIARDGETMSKLNELEEFKTFRAGLKESGPVWPPKSTNLNLVGAAFDL